MPRFEICRLAIVMSGLLRFALLTVAFRVHIILQAKLNVKQTRLTVDALALFCNGNDPASVFIEADCGGSNPEVTCPCCAVCCDDATNECVEQ